MMHSMGSCCASADACCACFPATARTAVAQNLQQPNQHRLHLLCLLPRHSPDGSCPCPCNYQTDTGCTCRDLQSSISISLSKSTVWASYPMEYLQTFNYKPYEAVVRPSNNVCLVRLLGEGQKRAGGYSGFIVGVEWLQ